MISDKSSLLDKARKCLELEIAAIQNTADNLDDSFVTIIEAIHNTVEVGKKLIFTGVGKNSPICQKLAGTFNSTGVQACYLDPVQALHGDLGICSKNDLAFLISNSGQTEELTRLLMPLKRLTVRTVAITSDAHSDLAKNCDHSLLFHFDKEACPLNLAPTASAAAALALGDAIAMTYLEVRGFTREDFAKLHPSGSLGKFLLLRVGEITRTGEKFATLPETCTVQEAIIEISKAKCGTIALTDTKSGKLKGVFSDGDFRRCALAGGDFMGQPVKKLMTTNPKTVGFNNLAVDALRFFEKYNINDLVVVDKNNKPVGIIDGQDLPKFRIV